MKFQAPLTLFLGILASASAEFVRKVEEPTQLHDVMFQSWANEHEKEYSSDFEKEHRMRVWMQNHSEYRGRLRLTAVGFPMYPVHGGDPILGS
jgi:hypothetical protein